MTYLHLRLISIIYQYEYHPSNTWYIASASVWLWILDYSSNVMFIEVIEFNHHSASVISHLNSEYLAVDSLAICDISQLLILALSSESDILLSSSACASFTILKSASHIHWILSSFAHFVSMLVIVFWTVFLLSHTFSAISLWLAVGSLRYAFTILLVFLIQSLLPLAIPKDKNKNLIKYRVIISITTAL